MPGFAHYPNHIIVPPEPSRRPLSTRPVAEPALVERAPGAEEHPAVPATDRGIARETVLTISDYGQDAA